MATSVAPKLAPPRRHLPLCLGCNYSLRGLAENRCPECGREFNLQDPTTFNNARPLRWIDRKLLRPIGWPMFTAIGLLCCGYLYLAINPAIYYFGIHIIVGFLLFVAISILLIIRSNLRHYFPPRSIFRSSARQRERRALGIFAVTFLLVLFHIPLRIMFFLAKPELDRVAQGIMNGTIPQPVTAHRAGPIVVSTGTAYGNDDQIFFVIKGLEGGFVYCRIPGDGLAYNSGADGHIWGNWYWWTDD
jgi:hypothetical protein